MSYETSEQSAASGRPIELHDFYCGITHWRLTSSGEDIEYLGHTYESAPCERTEIEQTGDPFRDRIEVTLPRSHALAGLYIPGVPEGEVNYTNYRGHGGDYQIYYHGIVEGVTFDENDIPKAGIALRSSSNSGVGRRRNYSTT